MIYQGDFSSWRDVALEFGGKVYGSESEQKAVLAANPEPEEVLVAAYETGDYSGTAVVVYRNGETYYSVYGSHCSCYGLEDQFEPDTHTTQEALAYWERMAADGYGIQKTLASGIIDAIKARIHATSSIKPAAPMPAHYGRF